MKRRSEHHRKFDKRKMLNVGDMRLYFITNEKMDDKINHRVACVNT